MDKRTKELLSWHNRLGHINFRHLQNLEKLSFIPKYLTHCPIPICASCQFGKWYKRDRQQDKSKTLWPENITKPGQLIHMDQAESSTPGRPLTYSGRNNKKNSYNYSFCRPNFKEIFCWISTIY